MLSMPKKSTPLARIDSAYACADLSPTQKAVLVYLARRSNTAGVCWPRVDTIAAATSLSERAVKGALAVLRKRGLIRTWRERRTNAGSLSGTLSHLNFQLNLRQLGLVEASTTESLEEFRARELERRRAAQRMRERSAE